jgi:hypothetical protein
VQQLAHDRCLHASHRPEALEIVWSCAKAKQRAEKMLKNPSPLLWHRAVSRLHLGAIT